MRTFAVFTLSLALAAGAGWAQAPTADTDPPPPRDLPDFWRSTLEHVDAEVRAVRAGTVDTIAVSPGGRPVYAVRYGERDDLRSQANYNSAVAAQSPAWYARKDETTKPVILFLGPVHGQEVEGVVGLVNLIHVAETGADHRGRPWPELKRRLDRFRVLIVPSANPDGRARCPYDSFVGVPTRDDDEVRPGDPRGRLALRLAGGQGGPPHEGGRGDPRRRTSTTTASTPCTTTSSSRWRRRRGRFSAWPVRRPPTWRCRCTPTSPRPVVLQASYVPIFMKERIRDLSRRVKDATSGRDCRTAASANPRSKTSDPGPTPLLQPHQRPAPRLGRHGLHLRVQPRQRRRAGRPVTHDQILDVQLLLYDEMLRYVLENRLCGGRRTEQP